MAPGLLREDCRGIYKLPYDKEFTSLHTSHYVRVSVQIVSKLIDPAGGASGRACHVCLR